MTTFLLLKFEATDLGDVGVKCHPNNFWIKNAILRKWDASPDSQASDSGGISTQASEGSIVLEKKKELISEDVLTQCVTQFSSGCDPTLPTSTGVKTLPCLLRCRVVT